MLVLSSDKTIVDRTDPASEFSNYFKKASEVLRDIVDYGAQLVPTAFSNSSRQMEDIITIGVLLHQVVMMVDGVEILMTQVALKSAHLQSRACLEASWYVDWILKEKSEERARYYYVSCLRQFRDFALSAVKGTPERQRFSATADFMGLDDDVLQRDLASKSSQEVEEIDKVLGQTVFSNINKTFEKLRTKTGHNRKGKPKQGKKAEPKWYEPLGPKSISDIATQVDRLHEYQTYYARCSKTVHVASYRNHVRFESGKVNFLPVRDLGEIKVVFLCIAVAALRTYRAIISRYCREEVEPFLQKYKDEWRETIDWLANLRIDRRVFQTDIDA